MAAPPPTSTPFPRPALLVLATTSALALGFLLLRPVPRPPPPPPPPTTTATLISSPSSSPPRATLTAHSALRSIRTLNPRQRITDLHQSLQKITGKWFKSPPHPAMRSLRESFSTTLRAHLASANLETTLRALAATHPHFHTLTASDRLDVYLALADLEDLENYCETFGIQFLRLARAALPPHYGMLPAPDLHDSPAVGFALLDTSKDKWYHPPPEPHSDRWRIADVRHPMRFHDQGGGAEESDMIRTLGEGHQKNLTFEPREPLDVPLERCGALELSGYISALFPNARFDVDLSDGSGFRTVAVVRLDTLATQRWYHTVERELFRGSQLKMRVRYRVLPDMNAGREYAHLYQIQLHYRER